MASRLEEMAEKFGVTDRLGLDTPAAAFSRVTRRHPMPPAGAGDDEKRGWVESVVAEISERHLPVGDQWHALYDELSLAVALLLALGDVVSIDIIEGNRIQVGLCIGRWCFVDVVSPNLAQDGLWTYKKTAGSGRTQWNKIS